MRSYPNAFDPQMMTMFRELRQNKNVFDSNVNSIRKMLNSIQSSTADIVLSLLKGFFTFNNYLDSSQWRNYYLIIRIGGNLSKARTMQWLFDCLSLNVDAEKGIWAYIYSKQTTILCNCCCRSV